MPQLDLFVAPHTCAIVPTIALEEMGAAFNTHLVRLATNQQNDPDYRRLNPKGKVPTLLVDGEPLTENPAILSWLNRHNSTARLLPEATSDLKAAQHLADLVFFASTVHPTVARVAMPMRFFPDKNAALEQGRPMAMKALGAIYQSVDARLSTGPWWYGQHWSIIDAYLYWTWRRVTMIGFPVDDFPNIAKHHEMSQDRPAVQRAEAREAADIEILISEGCYDQPS